MTAREGESMLETTNDNESSFLYDIFLSYSDRDREEATEAYADVLRAGGRAFLAPKEISAGDDFADKILRALERSAELWLIASPSSLNSEWVILECGAAWALRKKIIPILLRCAPNALPERLRRFQCTDYHKIQELIGARFGLPPAVQSAEAASLFNPAQFETYRAVWNALCDLQASADTLWEEVDLERVRQFAEQRRETKYMVRRNAVLLEQGHLDDLEKLFDAFWHFRMGKGMLGQMMEKGEWAYDREKAEQQIDQNRHYKERYDELLESIRRSFFQKLSNS